MSNILVYMYKNEKSVVSVARSPPHIGNARVAAFRFVSSRLDSALSNCLMRRDSTSDCKVGAQRARGHLPRRAARRPGSPDATAAENWPAATHCRRRRRRSAGNSCRAAPTDEPTIPFYTHAADVATSPSFTRRTRLH